MKRRVVVTGMGLVAGNARDHRSFAKLCFEGKGSIGTCTAFDPYGLSTPYFGEVMGCTPEDAPNARFHGLLAASAENLLRDAGLTREEIAAWGTRCRMFFGTLIFSSDLFYRHSLRKRAQESEADDFIAHMNDFSAHAKNLLGVKGSVTVLSSSCAAGTTAAGMAMDYIRSGVCDRAIVGGVDALSVVTAYGFNALKSLSSGVTNPFDEERDGINIGECGVFFLFESLDAAEARGAEILGEIAGYALGNDAYHITSPRPDGEGAYRVMREALADAGITPEDIGYINVHGTGTQVNDAMEIKAVEKLFGDVSHEIALSSTKALLGHCMGASGAIELASVLLSLHMSAYLPMPHLKNSIARAPHLRLSDKSFELDAGYALKNSFAFSGNSASLVVRRYGKEVEDESRIC